MLRRIRRVHTTGTPARVADEEELSRAHVDPERAAPAYEGSAVIQASDLQTPEEARESKRAISRRDEPGTTRLLVALNVGVILCALAYVLFQGPSNLAIGGASGLSIVLSSAIPGLSNDVALWIVNAVLVIVGLVFVERKAVVWSVVASVALSAYVSLFRWLIPVSASITGDLWLDLCCTVLLVALGNAIAYNAGASTGGMEIVVMALARHTSLPVGHAVTVANGGIVCAGVALYGPHVGLYCVLGLLVQTVVVNGVLDDLKQHKICTVICRQPARVEEFLVRKLSRTATITRGYGAYSGREVSVIMTVLTRAETTRLEKFLREIDPDAFVTYVNTSQITGHGFRWV